MKRLIKNSTQTNVQLQEPVIKIVMYLHPDIYEDIERVLANVNYDPRSKKYHTDVNPSRIINGPLSEYGQQLENPIKDEYENFIKDCVWLIKEVGFTIIKQEQSLDSQKSEYLIIYGIDDTPCGTLIYDLRLSDHPFDATFPEHLKDEVVKYLEMNKILDGTAGKAGIDFTVEKITIGTVEDDTWDRTFNRLYLKLKKIRNAVRVRLQSRK